MRNSAHQMTDDQGGIDVAAILKWNGDIATGELEDAGDLVVPLAAAEGQGRDVLDQVQEASVNRNVYDAFAEGRYLLIKTARTIGDLTTIELHVVGHTFDWQGAVVRILDVEADDERLLLRSYRRGSDIHQGNLRSDPGFGGVGTSGEQS